MPFPGVQLTRRPLHFIYLCDCSGSMKAGGKIQALNQAIRQSLPEMVHMGEQNPEAQILVRVLTFADQAKWHIESPTSVDHVLQNWTDLTTGTVTKMGEALVKLAAVLRTPPMEQRALPPVLVLISDGAPTDDFVGGLRTLMAEPWAAKAVRLAIAIGHDADLDVLQQFIGPESNAPGRRPLQANDSSTLARHIKWASTAVVDAASQPRTQPGEAMPGTNVRLPDLPDLPETIVDPLDPPDPNHVW